MTFFPGWRCTSNGPFGYLFRDQLFRFVSPVLALNFVVYSLMLLTFATLWIEQYGQSALVRKYISFSLGFSSQHRWVAALVVDVIHKSLRDGPKSKEEDKPEFRAPYMVSGVLFIHIGLFWHGWFAEYRVTWVMVDIGAVIFTCGSSILSQASLAHTLDLFGELGAVADATRLLVNILAFIFPIFASRLCKRLGFGWGDSLLAFIFVTLGLPVPLLLWICGEKLRAPGKIA